LFLICSNRATVFAPSRSILRSDRDQKRVSSLWSSQLYWADAGPQWPRLPEKAEYAVVRASCDRPKFDGKHDTERNVWGCSVDSHCGTRDVSIPRDRRMGELESPSIWRLQFREDPSKDVVLLSTAINSRDKFFVDLAARERATPRSSAFRISVCSQVQRYVPRCCEENRADFIRPGVRGTRQCSGVSASRWCSSFSPPPPSLKISHRKQATFPRKIFTLDGSTRHAAGGSITKSHRPRKRNQRYDATCKQPKWRPP
jgi:hypothetical protein